MLKTAYALGVKLAYEEEGLSPEQMTAAKRVGGVGGGVAGASLGGLLGRYLGGRVSESFDLDPEISKTVGTGLGAVAGGGLGGLVGSQLPQWKYKEKEEDEDGGDENALGALPVAYNKEPFYGLMDDYGYGGGSSGGYYY